MNYNISIFHNFMKLEFVFTNFIFQFFFFLICNDILGIHRYSWIPIYSRENLKMGIHTGMKWKWERVFSPPAPWTSIFWSNIEDHKVYWYTKWPMMQCNSFLVLPDFENVVKYTLKVIRFYLCDTQKILFNFRIT